MNTESVWDYFFEDENGNVLAIQCNVPYSLGEVLMSQHYIDSHDVRGNWHPFEPC